MGASTSLQEGFAKWTSDFAHLRTLFCEMLVEEGDAKLAAFLEACFDGSTPPLTALSPRYCQALSIVFQLLDVVEEHNTNQVRRRAEDPRWREGEPGYWLWNLNDLRHRGFSEADERRGPRAPSPKARLHAPPTEAPGPKPLHDAPPG